MIALNRPVDKALAEKLNEQFIEVLIAPGYSDDALEVLTQKQNIRILEDNERRVPMLGDPEVKQVTGGLLVQDRDTERDDREAMEVVTERKPTDQEWQDLLFAWRVSRHVKSNAIVLAQGSRDGRDRRGADVARRLRAARDREVPRRLAGAAPRWRRTRSSRSPTVRSWRSRPA